MRGVGKDLVIQPRSGIVANGDRGLFAIWMCRFSVNNLFPFLLATGDVMMNRQCGAKLFLSVITAPIVLAPLSDFLIRQCHVNPQWLNIHPANLIRLAYSRYCINTSAPILLALWMFISWICKAETGPRLLAKTHNVSPIRQDNAYL